MSTTPHATTEQETPTLYRLTTDAGETVSRKLGENGQYLDSNPAAPNAEVYQTAREAAAISQVMPKAFGRLYVQHHPLSCLQAYAAAQLTDARRRTLRQLASKAGYR